MTQPKKRISIDAELHHTIEGMAFELDSTVPQQVEVLLETALRADAIDARIDRFRKTGIVDLEHKMREHLKDLSQGVNQFMQQANRINNLRVGERLAQLEYIYRQTGSDIQKLTGAVTKLAEWRSLTFWARIKRLFINYAAP